MPAFNHFDLALLNPAFDSPLVDVLTELEHLRRLQLAGTTPAPVFFQLKHVFHMLESLGSARIEGNHTTLADYVESSLDATAQAGDALSEIANIEEAMAFIEAHMEPGADISEQFIRELHAMAVRKLVREGDATPGAYRTGQVQIAQAEHLPPDGFAVPGYMRELVAFINQADAPKYDLIKVALAHHRFGWVHPFGNGNGRVVRLLTYALLIKYGFNVKTGGRVLNPTAVFCSDREKYYVMLATADGGTPAKLEAWCTYVLDGMLVELKKVDQLTQYPYLTSKILHPAVDYARQRKLISEQEHAVLSATVKAGVVKTGDLTGALPDMSDTQRTYQVRKLVEAKMLRPIAAKSRQYTIGFDNSYLMRGVIHALSQEGFISAPLKGAAP
jgi:Fic family protein